MIPIATTRSTRWSRPVGPIRFCEITWPWTGPKLNWTSFVTDDFDQLIGSFFLVSPVPEKMKFYTVWPMTRRDVYCRGDHLWKKNTCGRGRLEDKIR